LAGLNYVDAGQKADPAFVGPNLKNLPLMASDDLAVNIAATRAFLHDCFSRQPTQDEFETMLAFNMMVPPKVRLGLSNRPLNIDDILQNLKLPVLVTHGSEDKNSNLIAAEYTAKMIPGAKLSVYQGIGHSPFFEDPQRFNAELAAFVRGAQKVNSAGGRKPASTRQRSRVRHPEAPARFFGRAPKDERPRSGRGAPQGDGTQVSATSTDTRYNRSRDVACARRENTRRHP